VTHDQVEAMTLGDRVAVLKDGVLQQVATPQVLFNEPANVFVAGFIGSPEMNLVHAEHVGGTIRFGGHALPVPDDADIPQGRVILGTRASKFSLLEASVWPARGGRMSVTADVVEVLGEELGVMFSVDAPSAASFAPAGGANVEDSAERATATFIASLSSGARIAPRDRLELAVDTGGMHFFDPKTGLAIARPASRDLDGRSVRMTSTVMRAVEG